MVTFVKGDIFKSPVQVIANPINCVGVMGKGLAKVFAQKFPEMEKDYVKRCKNNNVALGVPYLWEDDKFQILNFPTKGHWKTPSRLEDIKSGLEYLSKNYDEMGISTLALPALGCGLGGLEWDQVKALMLDILEPISDLHVFVYEPETQAGLLVDNKSKSNELDKDNNGIAALPTL